MAKKSLRDLLEKIKRLSCSNEITTEDLCSINQDIEFEIHDCIYRHCKAFDDIQEEYEQWESSRKKNTRLTKELLHRVEQSRLDSMFSASYKESVKDETHLGLEVLNLLDLRIK